MLVQNVQLNTDFTIIKTAIITTTLQQNYFRVINDSSHDYISRDTIIFAIHPLFKLHFW